MAEGSTRRSPPHGGRFHGGRCMGAHILVVDDDPLLAAALRRPLAYEGFEVEVAVSGEEALTRALDHAPDLVILDVLLPGIDGLEGRRLRQAGEVAVLMLTARSEVPERVAGFEAGADDYLVKPFAFEELLVRVKALLRRGRNFAGGRAALRRPAHGPLHPRGLAGRADHLADPPGVRPAVCSWSTRARS